MNTNLENISAADLRRAADLSEEIEQKQAELAQILSGKKKPGRKPGRKPGAKKPGPKPGPKPGRKAAAKKPGPKPAKKKAAKKKGTRKISAASRKIMSEKRKAYWAAKRKEKAGK